MKSITATLFGSALDEGNISSVDDPVTNYLPDLGESGCNRFNLKDLLLMAGIEVNENSLDPELT